MLRNLSTQFLHSPSFTRQVLTQSPSAGCQQPSGPQKGSRIPRQTEWAKFTALCGALTSLMPSLHTASFRPQAGSTNECCPNPSSQQGNQGT